MTADQRLRDENKRLKAALRGLLPRGWRDGTMDHMPGIKAAREALGLPRAKRPKPMKPEHAAIYHGDIDGDFNY